MNQNCDEFGSEHTVKCVTKKKKKCQIHTTGFSFRLHHPDQKRHNALVGCLFMTNIYKNTCVDFKSILS